MTNFCTLFDSNYLTRGLALHESLSAVCPSFHLYVVAFDDACYEYLLNAGLPNLTPISLKAFEDEALLAVKPTRSKAEYCWTSTPSVILYCIRTFDLPSCAYVDADMIFYHNPQVLVDESKDQSIIITEHRYSKDYLRTAIGNGIYCVQFMYFRNDEAGLTALTWWRERCIEWCYDRLEDGKFGDQKYLDDWTQRFRGVHVMQHPGGGLACWNLQQYSFHREEGKLMVQLLKNGQSYPAVFFHFHGLKLYANDMASCCNTLYEVGKAPRELVFIPYLKSLLRLGDRLKEEGLKANYHGARGPAPTGIQAFTDFLKELGSAIKRGRVSPFKIKNYNFILHNHYYKLKNLR